jgi:beta-lactamase regulating signal transducer with metallopeptidase domain
MNWSQTIVIVWLQFILAAAGLFWLVRRAARHLPQPADRLRLIEFGLATAAVLPALVWFAPWHGWRLEIVTPVANVADRVEPISPAVSFQTESSVERAPSIEAAAPGVAKSGGESLPEPSVSLAPPRPTVPAQPLRSDSWLSVTLNYVWTVAAVAIVALHGAGLLWFLAVLLAGHRQWRTRSCNAAPPSENLQQEWNLVSGYRGEHVGLLVSTAIDAPLLSGWQRPVVMIPRELAEAGGLSLRHCLAHEWAHVARSDYPAWRGVDACQVLFWMLPAYWALRKELRLCQDMLADYSATLEIGEVVEYSALLVDFARRRPVALVAGALTFLDQPSQLTRRVKMLLEHSRSLRSHSTWRFSLVAATAACCLALLVSAIRIDATRGEEAKPKGQPGDAAQAPAKDEKPAAPAAEEAVSLTYRCSVVEKETGKGIAGALVVVRRSVLTSEQNRVLAETKHVTDGDGKYEFEIPKEQVAEGYLYIELDVEHRDYAARKGFGYALSMIRKNEKLGERPFFERTELCAGEAVTGTIVDPNGRPLPNVKVTGFSMASRNDFNNHSFTDTRTDDQGQFRLMVHKDADAVMWVVPKDFAIIEKFVAKQRGDLGKIPVATGVRVSGKVLGIDGKPIAGIPVNLEYAGERDNGGLPVASSVSRAVLSDAAGRFAFDPLPAGEFRLKVDEHLHDPLLIDRNVYSLPGVFVPKKVSLKANDKPAPVEIQAIPHVIVHAQYLDSAGKKTRGHAFFLHGQLDGESWFGQGRPNQEGTIVLKVPHGLEQAQMQLSTNEHGALRYRRAAGEPLQDNTYGISLGTLTDDIEGFEIIRYKAPVLLISAVDDAQQPIGKLKLTAKYATARPQQYISFENGSDFRFERQDDGAYRSSQMLPDEETTITVTADGFVAVEEKVNLKEGETKVLKVALPKAKGDATDPAK